jgi:hypothetical protein
MSVDPETVCHAGSNDDQVTFSASAPLISAANHDLPAEYPQHLAALVQVHRAASPPGSRPPAIINRLNPWGRPASR